MMIFRIHQEGRTTLFYAALLLAGVNAAAFYLQGGNNLVFPWVAGLSFALYLLLLNFFRNPLRRTVPGKGLVCAPADGKVVVIEETTEGEYFKDRRIQVSVFMSPLDVHVNRYPVEGTVRYVKYHPGKYLAAWHPKSSLENERNTVVIHCDGEGDKKEILVRQIAGTLARRIVCYAREGQHAAQGGELGFIKFGSRVDVFLPLNAEVKVRIGDKVRGGETFIAKM